MADEPTPEERESAQRISRARAVDDSRRLLHRATFGVLSTISKRNDGWPFGSIVPYALDRFGEPILLIASIAEHTKNVRADDRVSLLVHERPTGEDDVQAHGRLTLMGRAVPVAENELVDARARYLARVPDAAGYFATHDFFFHKIGFQHVRFIGGFGRIFWLDAGELREDPSNDPLAEGAQGVIDHMNEDHADALVTYCQAFKGVTPQRAEMVGVDQWGFDVRAEGPEQRFRFDFDEPTDMDGIRLAVVVMLKKARAALAE